MNTYVLPGLGEWRLRELGVPRSTARLRQVTNRVGPGAAKTVLSVLSGMLGKATRAGAVPTNPIRDISSIPRPKKKVRASTVEASLELLVALRADERAVALDLAVLAKSMLAGGMRIGEAYAIQPDAMVDGTVLVSGTDVRIRRQGLTIEAHPKSSASRRELPLSAARVDKIERRLRELRVRTPEDVLFPSPRGHLRDVSNTTADFRQVFATLSADARSDEPAPWSWVTSLVFRKTVATRLDDAGFCGRDIANFLGHEQPSMTTDVYMSRTVVNHAMAQTLDLSSRPKSAT